MLVRFLTTPDARSLQARFGTALGGRDAAALAASAAACVLAVDEPLPPRVAEMLRAAGATVVAAGPATLIGATSGMVKQAADRADAGDRAAFDGLLRAATRAAVTGPDSPLRLRERTFDVRDRALVMGIVNVTPDSFYDRVDSASGAVAQARAMVGDGAAIVDVGGQSYAAGLPRIDAAEEIARVVPAIAGIRAAGLGVALSVDTFKAPVADAALAAGAHLINDCSGLSDPALADVVAKHGASLVVMHIKGRLNDPRDPRAFAYGDAMAEIVAFLHERTERAVAAGVARDAIVVDPGLEFGKEPETDLEILQRFGELRALGYPVLLASSRKSFLGRIFGVPAQELLVPSLAAAAAGIAAGARLVRVHDVAETVQLTRMLAAIASGDAAAGNHARAAAV